jgi:REP element-mobilizing transposase RayT
VDTFTSPVYNHIIVDSLKYCQEHKGLDLYAWSLMSDHFHLIAAGLKEFCYVIFFVTLKNHTSKKITSAIETEHESMNAEHI